MRGNYWVEEGINSGRALLEEIESAVTDNGKKSIYVIKCAPADKKAMREYAQMVNNEYVIAAENEREAIEQIKNLDMEDEFNALNIIIQRNIDRGLDSEALAEEYENYYLKRVDHTRYLFKQVGKKLFWVNPDSLEVVEVDPEQFKKIFGERMGQID